MVMKLPVSAIKTGRKKRVPDCIHNKGDAFHLALKTIGKFTTHNHSHRIIRISDILVQQGCERCPFPERAVMEVRTSIIDDFKISTPHIDPNHIRVTFPCVSKRALPVRCTWSGPPPFDAATRISAISSFMQAAMPTRLVVIRGFTSTTYTASETTISIPQYPWHPRTSTTFLATSMISASRAGCTGVSPPP